MLVTEKLYQILPEKTSTTDTKYYYVTCAFVFRCLIFVTKKGGICHNAEKKMPYLPVMIVSIKGISDQIFYDKSLRKGQKGVYI